MVNRFVCLSMFKWEMCTHFDNTSSSDRHHVHIEFCLQIATQKLMTLWMWKWCHQIMRSLLMYLLTTRCHTVSAKCHMSRCQVLLILVNFSCSSFIEEGILKVHTQINIFVLLVINGKFLDYFRSLYNLQIQYLQLGSWTDFKTLSVTVKVKLTVSLTLVICE